MIYNKEYWTNLYNKKQTGWDIGYISPPIKEYIDQLTDKSIKILIPGAGNAYEIEYLHKKGFNNCYLLDFANEPINHFLERVPDFPINHIIKEDFFKHKGQYDLIIEHTFFSSISPSIRNAYVNKIKELLKDKAKLIGLLFNISFNNDFPPVGGDYILYNQLFMDSFNIDTLEIAYNSIKPRNNNELFMKLTKK
jgi:thiopurine S-methyltransferase